MTPEMSARDVTFARRTTTIEALLSRYWHWGERGRMNVRDPQDELYGQCYPNAPESGPGSECKDQNGIAAELIDRRHEKLVLDGAAGSGALPARRARGAQGDSRHLGRLVAVSPRQQPCCVR